MKKCSKCEIEKEEDQFWKRNNRKSGVNSECKACAKTRRNKKYKDNIEEFRAKRKEYYYSNREYLVSLQVESQRRNKNYRKYQNKRLIAKKKSGDKKFLARSILSMALRGKMISKPENCTTCGIKGKIEGHHSDYNKPLEVLWLCVKCHRQIHKELKK